MASANALRVLVIDDDAVVLMALANMIGLGGDHVTKAAGGREGIEAFERSLGEGAPFDVVFTDLSMPEVDGREVARFVKRVHAQTCVIMLSGWGPGVAGAQDLSTEVDHMMGKPPRLADFRAIMASLRRPA